ncbi:MAG: SH3 domain-containing protein, partial [Methyloceanibacter sp.]
MQRTHAMIGLASLFGALLFAGPASAVTAYSPTGHLNVRSGPGFQYPVVGEMQQNVPAAVTGCISNYT